MTILMMTAILTTMSLFRHSARTEAMHEGRQHMYNAYSMNNNPILYNNFT